jgi:hypothetical protein
LFQQVVIGFAISMCAEVWVLSVFPYDQNLALLTGGEVDREEAVGLFINPLDGLLPLDPPAFFIVSDVRNVFVPVMVLRLIDAGDVVSCHNCFLSLFAKTSFTG